MDKYEDLRILEELRSKGAISEEEFQKEKAKILNSGNQRNSSLGMDENTYLTLMHLSQFGGFIVPGLGFIIPIVMWLVNADKSEAVNMHGKNIANFMLSMLIYVVVSAILCLLLVGFVLLAALAVIEIVFIILAAVKANRGEYWPYPITIRFFS